MRAKLGLASVAEGDRPMIEDALRLMGREKTDHTLFWLRLTDFAATSHAAPLRDLFVDAGPLDAWLGRYEARLALENHAASLRSMQQSNPRFVLRNYIGETVIRRARDGDFGGVAEWLAVLEQPYDEHPQQQWAAGLPPDWAAQISISCSS